MVLMIDIYIEMFVRIKEQILDSESRYVVEREDRIAGYQNGGYSSGQVSSRYQEERSVDGDLKNMGYSIYSGNNRNREENIPMQNVRYDDVVIRQCKVVTIQQVQQHDEVRGGSDTHG